jgi:succinyl-CoA synthetase beta subunit
VPVGKVLVERAADVAHELYVAVLIDRAVGGPVVIASDAGGMEIEEVAAKTPERIHRQVVDPLIGLRTFQARRLAKAIDLTGDTLNAAVGLTQSLYRLFEGKDCSLVEVNPLVVTSDGKLLAVDAKVNIEDYALPRHPELAQMHDPTQEDPLEARAASYNVNYVRLDGQVGCLVNGAGLAMATMDIVRGAGWSPANFLDVGGRADAERVAQATDIILSDPNVKQVLINVFGGILRCDIVAQGVIQAYKSKGSHVPMVVRMLGTNVGEGKRMLAESGLPVTFADTLADAVRAVSEAR